MAMNKYNYFKDNKDLLNEYDRREAYLVYQASLMRGAKEDGFEEGMKERDYAIAKSMKNDGVDFNLISKYTGLNIEEIEKL